MRTARGHVRTARPTDAHSALQKQVVRVLVAGQILGGIGMGATLSLGALLAAELSGSSAWSGMAATMSTLGAAVLAVPLARLAQSRGRRISLASGALLAGCGAVLAIVAAAMSVFALLLLALMLLGAGSATNLQARFAATDLASTPFRARDLSIVVWSTTIGAVLGPNLFGPGEALGAALGLPAMTGAFVFSLAATGAASVVYSRGLRPDPLLTALAAHADQTRDRRAPGGLAILRGNPVARFAVAVVSLSHMTMVALMSMAPVHLRDHGATLPVVGLTISLHVAGMYALSPVFGWLSDRFGRLSVILGGQGLLGLALLTAWLGDGSPDGLTACLVLLGLGWSASVVAGSALISEAVEIENRSSLQGFSDLSMNAAGALGGAVAGPVLVVLGYSGLGAAATALVAIVVVWGLLHAARLRGQLLTPQPRDQRSVKT